MYEYSGSDNGAQCLKMAVGGHWICKFSIDYTIYAETHERNSDGKNYLYFVLGMKRELNSEQKNYN